MMSLRGWWQFKIIYAANKQVDHLCMWIARHMPTRLRVWVVVDAAVVAREPEMKPGGGYCGPDDLTYKDLYDGANRTVTA